MSILRNSTTPNTLAVGSSNLNVATYGDENEPDDPNDDSLMEENSQSGNHQESGGSTAVQPMELDYDDDNTNQSTASNQGVDPKPMNSNDSSNPNIARQAVQVGLDPKTPSHSKVEPEKEKNSSNVSTNTISQSVLTKIYAM